MLRKPGMEGIFSNIITGIKKKTHHIQGRDFLNCYWSYFLKGKVIIVVDAMTSIKKVP